MKLTTDTLTHIVDAVRLDEKHRGNPYQYLLDRWDRRGRLLLEAANTNTQGTLDREDLETLALAWDLQDAWEGPKSAILGLFDPIQALRRIGPSIAQIRAICVRLEGEVDPYPGSDRYERLEDRLQREVRDLTDHHQRELDQLDDLQRKDDRVA